MKRKYYLMIIILLILFSSIENEAQQWIKMNPQFDPPGDYNLGRGIMLDKNNGWVVEEYNQKAFQTTDGGLNWKERLSVDNPSYGDLFFLDKTNGWITFASNDSTVLFRTKDSGVTWTRRVIPFIYRVFFISDKIGFGGGKLNFYKTTDGGINWNKVDLGETKYYFFMSDSYIFNQTNYLLLTSVWNGDSYEPKYAFAILKTTNGGNSWFKMQTNLNSNIRLIPRSITFVDSLNGVLTTWLPIGIYFTVDGGDNWTQIQNLPEHWGEIDDLFLSENSHGWIIGNNGYLIKTTDKGVTWQRADSLTNQRLYSISFLKDNSTGFIFGSHNTILRYVNPVGIKDELEKSSSNFSFLKNYPNPFNSTTTFTFNLFNNGYIELKVYDIIGREIKTIVKGEFDKGEHNIQFNASDLTSGMYLGVLFFKAQTISRKILIIK